MRAITLVFALAVVFVAIVMVVIMSGSRGAATPAAASQAVAAPASAAQGTSPQGTILGKGSQKIGDLTVWLSAPQRAPVRGQNTIEALVLDGSGQAVNDASVSFDLDMTNMSHGKNVVTAQRSGDGRYTGNVTFMMPGPWRIIAVIDRGGKSVGSARFDFNVNIR